MRIAAAGAAAIFAAVAGCASPASSQPAKSTTLADASTAPLTLTYACQFPAGSYQVGARITASYPATAVVGRSVRPSSLTLAVTVPAAALTGLGLPGATVAVAARLATSGAPANSAPANSAPANSAPANSAPATGAATASSAPVVWTSLAASSASLPATGHELRTGPMLPGASVPALPGAARTGAMTVTAGRLTLRFTHRGTTPGSAPTAPTAPTTPVTLAAACTLKPGQTGALATITVQRTATNPAKPNKPAAKPRTFCPPLPKGGLKLNPHFPLPKRPKGATVTHPGAELGCAYIVGYADVRKLNGAALVGPGLTNLAIGERIVLNLGSGYFEEDSAAELDFRPCRTCHVVHGLPPARATFLAFGFMPVSATLQLTEVGTINIIGVGTVSALKTNTAWSLMSLRVSDVKVNGQPLAVGGHCQTARPVLIKLTGLGTGPEPYTLQGGGPLTGKVTIPPFTGCGVTENLDPLFTGTVSGPDNFAKLTQGSLCTLIGNLGCPAPIPKPRR